MGMNLQCQYFGNNNGDPAQILNISRISAEFGNNNDDLLLLFFATSSDDDLKY